MVSTTSLVPEMKGGGFGGDVAMNPWYPTRNEGMNDPENRLSVAQRKMYWPLRSLPIWARLEAKLLALVAS